VSLADTVTVGLTVVGLTVVGLTVVGDSVVVSVVHVPEASPSVSGKNPSLWS